MKSEFRTSDLTLSAYLKVSGVELIDVFSVGRGKSEFVFQDTDRRQKLVIDYLNNRATVDPLAYMNTLKSLKAMAQDATRNEMTGATHGADQHHRH